MIICRVDSAMIFTGETREIADSAPVPPGWIATDEPTGAQPYQQWRSTHWHGLDEYPQPPAPGPPPVPEYSKLKIVEAADALGKLSDLEAILTIAPIRVRMRWQTASTLMGDDPDLLAMVGAIQQAWQLTDEQMAELLKQCTA